jgi:cytochrome c oxidase assembly factor CtaG
LLLLVVPPLLLMGIPDWLAQAILDRPLLARVERLLARPLLALFLYLATIWVWHLPALYDAAVLNEGIHILEHLLFLVTATIFWWPILAPVTACRMDPMLALFYLFAAGAANSVLGIILTFAPVDIYPIYLSPLDSLGALPLIRQQWGLTRAVDQQVGGLLMWVPGMLAYLFGAIAELARWYGTPEEDVVQISDTLSQPTVP